MIEVGLTESNLCKTTVGLLAFWIGACASDAALTRSHFSSFLYRLRPLKPAAAAASVRNARQSVTSSLCFSGSRAERGSVPSPTQAWGPPQDARWRNIRKSHADKFSL